MSSAWRNNCAATRLYMDDRHQRAGQRNDYRSTTILMPKRRVVFQTTESTLPPWGRHWRNKKTQLRNWLVG